MGKSLKKKKATIYPKGEEGYAYVHSCEVISRTSVYDHEKQEAVCECPVIGQAEKFVTHTHTPCD